MARPTWDGDLLRRGRAPPTTPQEQLDQCRGKPILVFTHGSFVPSQFSARLQTVLFEPTRLSGACIVRPEPRLDERGYFTRTFCEEEFAKHNLPTRFPQCNISRNTLAGTLRGMHFERPFSSESKFVRCISGAIHDVIIDLRQGSPTRFEWIGADLTRENGVGLFVPPGFAHGFITLTDETDVFYHMGDFYRPGSASGLKYNDSYFGIEWPRQPAIISERDGAYPDFDPEVFDD